MSDTDGKNTTSHSPAKDSASNASGDKNNLINLISGAYLQRSINSAVEITLQDQVNSRNQRMLLVSKQLNNLVNMK